MSDTTEHHRTSPHATTRTAAPRDRPRAASTPSPAATGTRSSAAATRSTSERIVVNMGPQHPSTHGVLRLILELEGETVTEARVRSSATCTPASRRTSSSATGRRASRSCTRMDYLAPLFNETAYCLAVEKLLGIEDQIPERASVIRVLLMELNRISSHLVALATGGMELGAHDRDALRLPRARADPRHLRDDHRPADEPRLHPPRRRRPGPAARRGRQDPRVRRRTCASKLDEYDELLDRPTRSGSGRAQGRRLPRPRPAAWRSASPARCCAPPGCRWTCARPSPTAATRPTTSTSSPQTTATPTAATWSG